MMQFYTPDQISNILGADLAQVQNNLPVIESAMAHLGLVQRPDMIAVLATIGVEVPDFAPIPEWGTGTEYEGRTDLGNIYPGDGVRYKGRGYIQLTGRSNYTYYGRVLGRDLVNHPELALDPEIAAIVLVQYFVDRGTAEYARSGNWSEVRITVNGGLNGWSLFWSYVQQLARLAEPLVIPNVPLLRVTNDTELRDTPDLYDVHKPIILLKTGTMVQSLGPWTPHWKYIKMSDGTLGWVYAPNLAKV